MWDQALRGPRKRRLHCSHVTVSPKIANGKSACTHIQSCKAFFIALNVCRTVLVGYHGQCKRSFWQQLSPHICTTACLLGVVILQVATYKPLALVWPAFSEVLINIDGFFITPSFKRIRVNCIYICTKQQGCAGNTPHRELSA